MKFRVAALALLALLAAHPAIAQRGLGRGGSTAQLRAIVVGEHQLNVLDPRPDLVAQVHAGDIVTVVLPGDPGGYSAAHPNGRYRQNHIF